MKLNSQMLSKFNFCTRIFNHNFQFQCEKWIVSLNIVPPELSKKNNQAIKPASNYSSIWMTLVNKETFFQKGREQFSTSFRINDVIRLTHWNFDNQAFRIITNNQWKEEVVSIQQSTDKLNITFTFFNNKLTQEKNKQFCLKAEQYSLFKQTLKSAYLATTFSSDRFYAQDCKLFSQIKKQMKQSKQKQQPKQKQRKIKKQSKQKKQNIPKNEIKQQKLKNQPEQF